MAERLRILRTVPALRRMAAIWRRADEKIALVPTMGALHDGHLALVKVARRRAQRVIVSIFVNPTQFAPTEDFGSYPRTFASDIAALRPLGVDAVWAPPVTAMYPEGFATRVVPAGAASVGLEDASRPHFFGGVATVVCKLFTQCTPDFAVFGEKDYQQLKVVTQMARDLAIPTTIIGVATVREPDGLAMSSRNVYLSPAERGAAATLYATLKVSAGRIAEGGGIAPALAAGRKAITAAGFDLDYLEARHAETLEPVRSIKDGPLRLLVAAKIGSTRLIDNIAVPKAQRGATVP